MKNKNVYCYLMAQDTGFAPCYDSGLFSLACCKPTIRKSIYKRINENSSLLDEGIYVIGVKHKGEPDSGGKYKSEIVYIARITEVKKFEDYFTDKNESRNDCVYKNLTTEKCEQMIKNNDNLCEFKQKTTRKKAPENPHFCNTELFRKDISGLCVLLSDDFYYIYDKEIKCGDVLKNVYEHCQNRRPGVFFYPEVDSKKLNKLLTKLEHKGFNNRKGIIPDDKQTCKCKGC